METPLPAELEPRQATLADRRRMTPVSRQAARTAFWRMLALTWPHRKPMTWGVVLGLGVALTYATSLGGLLPVLKVIVEKQNLNAWLLERAAHAEQRQAFGAAALKWLAGFFPAGDSAAATMNTLLVLMGVLLAINLVGNVLRCISQYLVLYASHRSMMDLRRQMYRKALRVPMSAVSGDLSATVSQFMSEQREIFMGVTTLFGKVAREPLKAVCVLGVALAMDARLTLIALAIVPPAVGLLWYFGRKVRKATVRLLQGYGLMLGALEETLQGIAVVKGYAREGHERKRMWALERRMLSQQLKLSWIEAISSPLIEVVGVLAAAAGVIWLAQRTFGGEMSTSQFGTMVVLLAAMLDPIRKVANVYNMVQRSGAAATRVFAFLDQPEEHSPPSAAGLPTAAPRPREVRFERVGFRYRPDAPPALQDVSLSVRPGECVAVVGPNGSGKSTLLRILPHLLAPQEGRILIDGIDTRDLSLKALREQIAIVDQRPVIFARSVAENIAYGKTDASLDEIRDAARRAYAADFIEQLPQQYQTIVGEFGATLSGGQRQRLSIARVFLKPASILVFDEATSEIDAESERKIHAALDELRRGKTTFLIAHRHTVMEMAERIAVMDAGRLIDFGTREELLSRCPLFVALYRSPGA
ncbi:putative multidrug export ATP-binding/permease protein [Phycisphaerae bacterium RAS1]|nr:putative multidrug export ATP-binding/permease protein [Phycisphaerae bacterium RAS1]